MAYPNLSQLPLIGTVALVYDPENPKFIDKSRLRVERTLGGGDCLYHALAQLSNHYRHPDAYQFYKRGVVDVSSFRNAVANIIDSNWAEFQSVHPELQSIDRAVFIDDVRNNRWAGEPEIDAALHLFPDVRVAVWTRDANNNTVLHSLVTPDDGEFKKTWHILMRANHYEWMSQHTQTAKNNAESSASVPLRNSTSARRSSTPGARDQNTLLRQLHEERRTRRETLRK